MTDFKKHREFIHDISNQLAITDGCIKRVQILKKKDQTAEVKAEIDKNLELSSTYSRTCITLLKEYRIFIHRLESEQS